MMVFLPAMRIGGDMDAWGAFLFVLAAFIPAPVDQLERGEAAAHFGLGPSIS